MLKEIHERPRAIRDTLRGRVATDSDVIALSEVGFEPDRVRDLKRVTLVVCGTSYHAAMLGKLMSEELGRLLAETDLASEFLYRRAFGDQETLVEAISQSGETADILGAAHVARSRECPSVAITNVVGSAIARLAIGVIYTQAGPEVGVASTKTFTVQIVASCLLALWLACARNAMLFEGIKRRVRKLLELPRLVQEVLGLDSSIARLVQSLLTARNARYLGRGPQYPVALEGALKLKELAYVHAEEHAGGEMKHGPMALLSDGLPVMARALRDGSHGRITGNIEEARARDARVIAVVHPGDVAVSAKAETPIEVPGTTDLLAPVVIVVPRQLLAYHVARLKGCDVDQPRNLAKSVTVE